jgi:hypothetical protein
LNDGITALPFVTRSTTSEAGGFASSRFGPTVPVAPASASVWHPTQPAEAKTALPAAASPCPWVAPVVVPSVVVSSVVVSSVVVSSVEVDSVGVDSSAPPPRFRPPGSSSRRRAGGRGRSTDEQNPVNVTGTGFRLGIHIAVISAQAMKSPATISSPTFPVVVIACSIGGRYHGAMEASTRTNGAYGSRLQTPEGD